MTTRREKKEDYDFFFTNGFMSAFNYGSIEDFVRVICWQHVKRNLEKRLPLIKKEDRDELKGDVHILQQCQSKKLFDNAVSLFLLKWEKEVNFLAYFEKMWLKDKRTG